MRKSNLIAMVALVGAISVVSGCSKEQKQENAQTTVTVTESGTSEAQTTENATEATSAVTQETTVAVTLEDGVYQADFNTDSSMFHANEACEGKGTLTVKDGQMVIHVSLASKGILNLYSGLAKDAEKEGAILMQPTTDKVTYKDGLSDEVYGFDIPVPYLDQEFDVALIGSKGKWYDHKVSVSNPVKTE